MNSGLSEARLRATLKKFAETDGVSADDFKTYYLKFNSTANGSYNFMQEIKELIKDESIKIQNASYSGSRSAVYC